MSPKLLLHLENAVLFGIVLYAYHESGGSWWLFAALFLAPDLSMVGYLANPCSGAALYNAVHTYVGPLLVAAGARTAGSSISWNLALIWFAHVALDRLLGFGLKYASGFKDTHLSPGRHIPAHMV